MRNLKRVLSLALAVVMVIGMMVMTTGAADFGDKAEIEYVEAVEVMSALGVLEGDDFGNFNPTDILTREQAAKIIAYMLLGKDNAEKLNANNTVFKDVAAGRWSAGYISYCTTLGILAGVGDGNFDPTGELTGVAFGKMLLVALAYDPKIEGYVGADWATNIATDMITAGIDVKGVTLSEPLTREQAAQMALQTLEADIVTYDERGWEMVLTDGTTVIVGASKAEAESKGTYGDYNINDNGDKNATLQFCEKYFEAGKNPMSLTKDEGAEDAYGRPGYKWTQKNKTIILMLDTPIATYTSRVKAEVVAADLNGYSLDVAGKSTKVNNLMDQTSGQTTDDATFIRTTTASGSNATSALTFGTETIAEAIADETANGKLVEVYVGGRDLDRIVEVEYTVAKLVRVTETKDKTTYNFSNGVNGIDYVNDNLTDNIKFHGDVARGEYVTMVKTGATYQVYATTSFTGIQTDYTTKLNTIVVGGETYKVGVGVKKADGTRVWDATAEFDNSHKNAEYFVDQYGYVVAAEGVASNEYVYIVAADATVTQTLGEKTLTVEARGIFADGTVGVYNIPVEKKGDQKWYLKYNDNVMLSADSALSVGDGGDEMAVENVLEGKVFGYAKTDAGLMLEDIAFYDPATDEAGGVYQVNIDNLKYNTTTYGGSGNTYLVDSDTVFVVYNQKTKRADTYVGGNSLPTFFDDSDHVFNDVATVAKYAVDNTTLISTVFVVTDGVDAEAIDEYVFVDTSKVTVSMKNGMTIYTYDGVKANGEIIQVSKKMSALDGDNVYAFDADCNITKDLNSELGTGVDPVVNATGGMKIIGNLVLDLNSGNYYELTEETVVVYVDDTLIGNFHGEGGWIVLTVENGNETTEIETIYVTEDLLLP